MEYTYCDAVPYHIIRLIRLQKIYWRFFPFLCVVLYDRLFAELNDCLAPIVLRNALYTLLSRE